MTRRAFIPALLALLTIGLPALAAPMAPTRYRLAFPDAQPGTPLDEALARSWREWLALHEYDVAGYCAAESELELILRDDTALPPLVAAGFAVLEVDASAPLADKLAPADEAPLRGVPVGYATPEDVEAFLTTVANAHPTITRLFLVGQSHQGRDIFGLEISDNPGVVEDKPAILLNGLHHAREVATPHVVMDAITFLTEGYATADPLAVTWVSDYKIICVPMINPDGSHEVHNVDDFHRKNMHNHCVSPTTNPGVDLNRNYPYHWGSGATACERSPTGASSGTCSSDTFRGPTGGSEPETEAMMDLAAEWRFLSAISYHSSGRFIDYPYACNDGNPDNRMPEHDVIHELMHGAAAGIAAVPGAPTYTVYSPVAISAVNGDDTSWYYAHHGTYALIIEMGTSFQPSFASSVTEVAYNRGGWLYLLDRIAEARIDVRVTDHLTGEPLAAQVELLDYVYDTGELPRYADATFGRRRFLVPDSDSYTLRVSLPGYITRLVPVTVGTTPVEVPVLLLATDAVLGDGDLDDDIDLADAAAMQRCAGEGAITPPCRRFDFTADEAVTAADLAGFAGVMTGAE
jgi:hypothetical protein